MSKLVTLFMIFICAGFCPGLSNADMSIVGEWSGLDSDGDSATFVFNEDKSAEVKFEGIPLLSTETLTNGRVEWSRNTDQDPAHLDIIIVIGSEEKRRIPMIARFVDDQTLKIQISRNMTTRPKGFATTKDVFQVLATKQ